MDGDKIEQTLLKILEYQSEHKVDDDNILIMLSLLDLMGMVNVLNSKGGNNTAGAGSSMDALLGPLMALMASGMGKSGPAGGGQSSFNPAALLGLLSGAMGGGQGKGGAPDLSALFSLLGPLLGMGVPSGQAAGQAAGAGNGSADKTQPVQREINLDTKHQTNGSAVQGIAEEKKVRLSKPGEVLKWNFGT